MVAVFGSSFVYWSAVKLFGKAMLQMFILNTILATMSEPELKNIKEGLLLSALPISRRTKGVLFDMFVSNPSLEQPIPFDSICASTLILHAEDDPAPSIVGARALSRRIHGGRLVKFERCGHLILGHETEIKGIIREFVSER